MAAEPRPGASVETAESWAEVADCLPDMLEQLLASEVYSVERRPSSGQRGIYLFSQGGEHLYVGLTSISARSRARRRAPITRFRHRFDLHTQLGRPPLACAFAKRLMLDRAADLGLDVPSRWWADRNATTAEIYDIYVEEKLRIEAMECRTLAVEDDARACVRAWLRCTRMSI